MMRLKPEGRAHIAGHKESSYFSNSLLNKATVEFSSPNAAGPQQAARAHRASRSHPKHLVEKQKRRLLSQGDPTSLQQCRGFCEWGFWSIESRPVFNSQNFCSQALTPAQEDGKRCLVLFYLCISERGC
jgi:hypothetical protein